ncbi:MAG TPA: hypothetical protein VFM81_05455 [Actinomycetota bacterium]|nr:hypothetical protein [Actinomycetota bacterium]
MAKKRRKPNRPRNRPQAGATRTAERPGSGSRAGADRASPNGAPGTARPAGPNAQAGPQRSRAEKKDLARQQREYVRRRMARARRARQIAWIAGFAAIVGVGAFWFTNRSEPATPSSLPGVLTTEAPWPANAAKSAARADALGLPAEGTTMHEHANVQVFINGTQEPMPPNIGIDESAGTIQSIHTHDDSGVVHLESSQARTFTLGEFFGVWGVRLTPSCIGGYCNDGQNQIRVYVDGEQQTGDPRDISLDDQSVIVVTYGTEKQLPDPIPSTFDFGSVPQ